MPQTAVRLTTLLVALFVLASEGAAAQDSPGQVGHLTAESATLRGTISLEATLAAFEAVDLTGSAENLRFTIRAEALRVETDQEQTLSAAGGFYGNNEGYNTTVREFSNVTVTSTGFRDSHYAAIVPVPSDAAPAMEWFSDQASLAASELASFQVTEYPFSDRSPPAADVGQAVAVDGAFDGFDATVRGGLVVSLWEWDVNVKTAAGSEDFSSGRTSEPAASDPSGMSGAAAERVYQRQLYLFVTNATIELSGVSAGRLFVHAPSSTVEGTMTFYDAAGEVADGSSFRAVQSDTLTFTGSLDSVVGPEEFGRLSFDLRGQVSGTASDGEQIAWVAPLEANSSQMFPWQWVLVAVAVASPGAFFVARTVRRRNDEKLMENLEFLAQHREFGAVVKGSERLTRSRTFGRDASVLKIESLIRINRLDDAMAHLDGLGGWPGGPGATLDYLAAEILALQGKKRAAAERLGRCLREAPEFRHEVLKNAAFAEIRETPDIAKLLSREIHEKPGGYA